MAIGSETLTFPRGGVHPPESKDRTSGLLIQVCEPPRSVQVLMVQHIGAPARPLVKKGDQVKKGQVIGEAQGYISANIHSPVSGKVKKVDTAVLNVTGRKVPAVLIENDGQETWASGLNETQDVERMDARDMIGLVLEGGVVGLGGAAFPTHVKLNPPEGSEITDVLMNATECEPYITCDHRLMVEKTAELIDGLKLIKRIAGAPRAHVCIEMNKPDAIEALSRAVAHERDITVHPLEVKYPQGAEQQLITALTGREVPHKGGLPSDVGCLVHNVGTVLAIRDAVRFRRPLIERVVTVTGDGIENAANLLVRIGTSLAEILQRQGLREGLGKLILGGPMMGIAQGMTEMPLVKGNTALLALRDAVVPDQRDCIRCGRCVEHCPLGLIPSEISIVCEGLDWDAALGLNVMECKECGCCSYVCPAKRRIVQMVKFAKAELAKRKRQK